VLAPIPPTALLLAVALDALVLPALVKFSACGHTIPPTTLDPSESCSITNSGQTPLLAVSKAALAFEELVGS
jgi:hypothetical protein